MPVSVGTRPVTIESGHPLSDVMREIHSLAYTVSW